MRYVILGTAGHIDHGKSALVEALTGINPDRLKEEKERGITIDLGFAFLDFPDGLRIGIVDVPGHERLIKNMLAGAGGIDLVLLAIAADEGIMPQTREHLAICSLLRIKRGLVAITKQDLVEDDWLSLLIDDIRNFLQGTFLDSAPIIPVSSKTGYNIPLLKEAIKDTSLKVEPKSSGGLFRLPVDRVFTMKGFGTVVTGTLLSGRVSIEDTVEILPKGIRSKVRGIQSHNQKVSEAMAGQRTALNLQGVDKGDIERGDVVTSPGFMNPFSILDLKLEILKESPPLKNRDRIRFHTGTVEAIGRVILYGGREIKAGGEGYASLRLETPVVTMAGDAFIIRRFSPLETLGGGVVLDPVPESRKRRLKPQDSRLEHGLMILEKGSLDERLSYKILSRGPAGIDTNSLYGWINYDLKEIEYSLIRLRQSGKVVQIEGRYIHRRLLDTLKNDIISLLEGFHGLNPLKGGMPKEDISSKFKIPLSPPFSKGGMGGLEIRKIINKALEELERGGEIVFEKDNVRLSSFKVELRDYKGLKERIIELYRKKGTQPPMREELPEILQINEKVIGDILKLAVEENKLTRINDSLYLERDTFDDIIGRLKVFFRDKKEISVAEFRDMFGTSRKYAIPIMEYLDVIRFTLRVGDKRVLRIQRS